MSIAHDDLRGRLEFGLPDRLGKALDVSGVGSNEMADYLGISRNTISNYTNGRTEPKKQTLRLWAMKTGVPLKWLETGDLDEGGAGPGGGNAETLQFRFSRANTRDVSTPIWGLRVLEHAA